MKKITLVIFAVVASISAGFSQANIIFTAPPTTSANGTSGNRGPNGNISHTVMRAMYNVPSTDMTPAATATALSSFGFVLTNTLQTAPASGVLTVYLQNSSSSTYTAGTTWSTAGMTQVYTGTYNIPTGSTATVVDFPFPVNFPYTGGALNVAYEYTASVTAGGVAIYSCYTSAAIAGATGATNTVSSPTLGTTTFKPLFRFGTPNTYTNEIIVLNVNAPGKYPTTFNTQETITADIKNGSNVPANNIIVGLNVTGVNTFTNVQIIPTLGAGAVTTVTFAPFTTTVMGINSVSVGVAPDQNSINNVITSTQSITCDVYALNPPAIGPVTYTSGVGFNTGSGIISSQFSTPVASTCISVHISIANDAASGGNPAYAVLLNSTGAIIGQTNTVTIVPSMYGTFQNFVFTATQALTAGTIYYIGLAQTSNTATGYFPLGASAPPANTPTDYYTSPLTGGSVSLLTANLGYFGIEPAFTSTCGSVGLAELKAPAKLSVYPNPTINGKAAISGLEGANTITVYNMLGQSLFTFISDKEEVSIDLINHPTGNYLVKITDSNKASRTVKIINQ